jgi:hypothetical protein
MGRLVAMRVPMAGSPGPDQEVTLYQIETSAGAAQSPGTLFPALIPCGNALTLPPQLLLHLRSPLAYHLLLPELLFLLPHRARHLPERAICHLQS